MTLSFAVVCEAPADRQTGCGLADRVFCAEVAWIEQEILGHLREWRGFRSGDPSLLWREVPELARSLGIRPHGHFAGEPGALEAASVRRALWLLHAASQRPDAIVLLRDDDGESERRNGFHQARETSGIKILVVIGLAHCNRECWVLAGFDPQGDEEEERLGRLRRQLGFDPREEAERLKAKHPHDKQNSKRVLAELIGNDPAREAECWARADLARLAARGQATGLADYLAELRERVVPLLVRDRRQP